MQTKLDKQTLCLLIDTKFKEAVNILKNFGIETDYDEITDKCRWAEIVFRRALVAYILSRMGLSTPTIGAIIKRDHATVLNLLKYGMNGSGSLKEKWWKITVDINQLLKTNKEDRRVLYHENALRQLYAKVGLKVNIIVSPMDC